jgi:Trypsin-like peptidase domain
MKFRPPRPASLCSVFIQKVCATDKGDIEPGYGTGFLCKDAVKRTWLVTNWHVLTARHPQRPEDPLSGYPWSPYRVKITFPLKQKGHFSIPFEVDLYKDGKPAWREYKREIGIDVAAMLIELPDEISAVAVQDFASIDSRALEPGLEVAVIGFPFPHGSDVPYPIWKRAMIAHEPGYLFQGVAQTMLDMPGHPGMSGSPVYALSSAMAVTAEQKAAFDKDPLSLLDLIDTKKWITIPSVLNFWASMLDLQKNRILKD